MTTGDNMNKTAATKSMFEGASESVRVRMLEGVIARTESAMFAGHARSVTMRVANRLNREARNELSAILANR